MLKKSIMWILAVFASFNSFADVPVAIDSRIKTYIYSENEVFKLVVNYGYQTSIEFAEGEVIQTISVGNNYLWQLTPVGRRLFIKPLEENIMTNMTILTNKRPYQFEIQSKSFTKTLDEELVYVIRFFYPEDNDKKIMQMPMVVAKVLDKPQDIRPFNFDYTLEGSKTIAPLKVFDDGINTFFKFPKQLEVVPLITSVHGSKKQSLEPRRKGDYIVVNVIAPKFEITLSDKSVMVFNENFKEELK
jgi:type IV secretion system protein VirB9